MILKPNEQEELELLFNAKDWLAVRAWFKYHEDDDQLARKILAWGHLFMPDFFPSESPEFHLDLIKELMSMEDSFNAAPRGFSKTTLIQLCIMVEVVNGWEEFIVVIEKAFNEAAEVLETVREQFDTNPLIRLVYGDLKSAGKDAFGDTIINNVRLRAKGFDAPIRGMKHRATRPTKIYADDLEKDEHINNPEQREKYWYRMTKGVMPALAIDGTLKVMGTILHNDSLLMNLINKNNGRIWRAWMDDNNPEGTLLWPTRWTYALLMERKEKMGTASFAQEYLNMPIEESSRAFKWDWLNNYYTEDSLPKILNTYIAIDAAGSTNEKADYNGVVVVSVDTQNNWYVRYAKRYRLTSKELIDEIFTLWSRWDPLGVGVEKAAFTDQIKPYLDIKSEEVNKYPAVRELKHKGARKEQRITGALSGRFEAGKIFFLENATDDTKKLINELYDFPKAQYDDLADALAYIEQLAYSSVEEKEDDLRHRTDVDVLFQEMLNTDKLDTEYY
jgi:phage terminase large subunit-like protein